MQIRLQNISFHYDQDGDRTPVLDHVGFTLNDGECVALIGPSGSGKSTLALHLNGLLKPQSGDFQVDGTPLQRSPRELKALRRNVAVVFQFPEAQIFESTVLDEIAFAARQWGIPEREIPGRVRTALQTVGLEPAEFLPRNPTQLSGGEARLVSIASLLIIDPQWLILDEPTLGLDLAYRGCVGDLIRRRRAQAKGIVVISHDMDLVYEICPRTLVLCEGCIRYDGATDELFTQQDISGEFGLEQPAVIALWKALKSAGGGRFVNDDFPDPELEKIRLWIGAQEEETRRQLCAVLRDYLEAFQN